MICRFQSTESIQLARINQVLTGANELTKDLHSCLDILDYLSNDFMILIHLTRRMEHKLHPGVKRLARHWYAMIEHGQLDAIYLYYIHCLVLKGFEFKKRSVQ